MKIALIGYGKMGKEIEKIALTRGHEIVARINRSANLTDLLSSSADVAIEFTSPDAAQTHIEFCLEYNIPVVIGTTGWYASLENLKDQCTKQNGSMLYATNFSLGVNIFFAVNKYLAGLMNQFGNYKASMTEIHHTQKLDAPSGTAISLAEQIIEKHTQYTSWRNVKKSETESADVLSIESLRLPDVPGTHEVRYESETDTLEIKHTAHNRSGFALGAVIAAEWIQGKKGIFTMNNVLNL